MLMLPLRRKNIYKSVSNGVTFTAHILPINLYIGTISGDTALFRVIHKL